MDNEKLTEELFETLDSINVETIFDKMKFSLKGENMLLAILTTLGGQSTLSKITEISAFTPARLSAVIKSLEAKGFVERVHNEDDRRTTTVFLTSEGAMQYLSYRQEAIRNAFVIVEQLGEEDVCEFIRIIRKIAEITNNAYENSSAE